MLLFGAGGHAKVLIEAVESNNQKVVGIFDDNASMTHLLEVPCIGKYQKVQLDQPLVLAIGNNKIRQKIVETIEHYFGQIFHKTALISPTVMIEEGTVVLGNATINSCATIGKHCIINTNAVIEHDCIIENYVHIAPNATLCGHVEIGEGTLIGAGAVVVPCVKIGKNCIIDAGVSVTQNVPDFTRIKAIPFERLAL